MFGFISLLCFLTAFVLYCFGVVCSRPFDVTGLTLLGLILLTGHVLWTGYLWRQMS